MTEARTSQRKEAGSSPEFRVRGSDFVEISGRKRPSPKLKPSPFTTCPSLAPVNRHPEVRANGQAQVDAGRPFEAGSHC